LARRLGLSTATDLTELVINEHDGTSSLAALGAVIHRHTTRPRRR